VPYYDPTLVFLRPRAGFYVGGAIRFGYGVRLGAAFAPWGWGTTRFGWGEHVLIVNGAPWRRTWVNRAVYAHPFAAVPRYRAQARPAERHAPHGRSERERAAERDGHKRNEEHGR
jgi:hypothetical protein